MNHTKEPWKVYEGERIVNDDEAIASCTTYFNQKDKENARRIVACVNACEGWSNEDLEVLAKDGGLRVFSYETVKAKDKELEQEKALADKLGEALQDYVDNVDPSYSEAKKALAEWKERRGK